MMTPAARKLTAARTDLILMTPFFGALALSLALVEDPTCQTAWTDGKSLGYNPPYIESLNHDETKGIIVHEVEHCAMGHPWRRDGRDFEGWNIACDLAINGDLRDSGFKLPAGVLFPDAEQTGKSAEWIYARLPHDPNGKPKGGKGKPAPGEVRDAPTGPDPDGNPAPTEGEWKQRTAEALQAAKMQGAISAGLARKIEDALGPRIDVRSLLLRFMTERARSDYSWTKPNPRYLSQGLYLPALESVTMGDCAIVIDTSGSVDAHSLSYAKRIVEDVMSEMNPSSVTIYYVDTHICGQDRFESGEPLVWQPKGGGGTSFKSCFPEIEKESPVCIIVISDLYASFPDTPSEIPTLWLSTTSHVAPWGETVPLPV